MLILDGKATALHIRQELAKKVQTLQKTKGRTPGLAVILVGEDAASQIYVRNKEKGCAEAGITSKAYRLAAHTTQEELFALIDQLNANPNIDGVLLQLPLPKHLNALSCLERIHPYKDVDGFHPINMGRLTLGLPCLRPCTPAGVMELLAHYNLSVAGKKAVVVGRSNIVGKPLALMLSAPEANATVTLCHSGTPNMKEVCQEADVLCVAIGKPKFITKDMVKPGAIVIDVGINRTEQGLCGDCDYEPISQIASAITPVPGGIGPMTIAMLLKNTVIAFEDK